MNSGVNLPQNALKFLLSFGEFIAESNIVTDKNRTSFCPFIFPNFNKHSPLSFCILPKERENMPALLVLATTI